MGNVESSLTDHAGRTPASSLGYQHLLTPNPGKSCKSNPKRVRLNFTPTTESKRITLTFSLSWWSEWHVFPTFVDSGAAERFTDKIRGQNWITRTTSYSTTPLVKHSIRLYHWSSQFTRPFSQLKILIDIFPWNARALIRFYNEKNPSRANMWRLKGCFSISILLLRCVVSTQLTVS